MVETLRAALLLVFALVASTGAGQTENVLLVTMDGLRWQELFGGADVRLMQEVPGGAEGRERLRERYDRETAEERRAVLMPYFWSTIAKSGQVYGDPEHGSSVRCTNAKFFSYPGYNELLCGFGDPGVDSNDKLYNRNVTVLEWLNRKPAYEGRVAAYGSWDVFPYIVNDRRSGVYVNAGWVPLEHGADAKELAKINAYAADLPRYFEGVRYDAITFRGALEHLRAEKPRVLYLSLGETDDWAHANRYDLYLDMAVRNDDLIRRLWEAAQEIDQYRRKTALVLTTDHGRGEGPKGWQSHGTDQPGSDRMWVAVMGPDTPAKGVVEGAEATQSQVAATVAALLGEDFTEHDPRVAGPLPVFE